MMKETQQGQTNYCPNCEDQARRIEELERHNRTMWEVLKSIAYDEEGYCLNPDAEEALNATPSHSAAWEWNQHVEWCRENLVAKGSSVAAGEPLYAMPKLKEVKE